MASLNQATLIGYTGGDPTVRMTKSGRKVASLTIATTDKGYTAKDGTVYPDRTEWHNVTLWGQLAEVAEKYVKKGALLYVAGPLRTREYEDKDGIKKRATEIEAETMQMLSGKKDDQNAEKTASETQSGAAAVQRASAQPLRATPQPAAPVAPPVPDDDAPLPF